MGTYENNEIPVFGQVFFAFNPLRDRMFSFSRGELVNSPETQQSQEKSFFMIIDQLLDLEKAPSARSYSDKEYDLEGYRIWLESLGSPHRAGQKIIHLAGTKGKGSTGALCEAILLGQGFPTTLYTSPHLEHFGERYRFDGRAWTLAEFEAEMQAFYDSLAPEQRRGIDAPHPYRTVFEMLTALAFKASARRNQAPGKPQAVILETGLGGRLDCTNVADPVVSVITTLGMDHTKILGDTIEKIAAEKAGIIKRGRPVVVARQAPEHLNRVWPVILRRAEEEGAPIVRAWEHNPVLSVAPAEAGQRVRLRLPDGTEVEETLPLRGSFQIGNLEAAVAACWYFMRECGQMPEAGGFPRGLPQTVWPGRLEVHENALGKLLILDGAHCPLSARALGREVARLAGGRPDPRFLLLFAMQRDKDAGKFLKHFLTPTGKAELQGIIMYPLGSPRGAEPEALVKTAADQGLPATAASSPAEAMAQAAAAGTHIVAGGTLYTIAALRDAWKTL